MDGEQLEDQFTAFSRFGNGGKREPKITLTQSDKWMRQANVIDGKIITTTDTAIAFNKYRRRTMTYQEFLKYLEELSSCKSVDFNAVKLKLARCGRPTITKPIPVQDGKSGIRFESRVVPKKQSTLKGPQKKKSDRREGAPK